MQESPYNTCKKCGTQWIPKLGVGCPKCQNVVELSGTLHLVNSEDYRFAPKNYVVTQRPMTRWERFRDWLKNCWPKPFIMGIF